MLEDNKVLFLKALGQNYIGIQYAAAFFDGLAIARDSSIKKEMRRSGFEPEFMAWQATVITTTLSAHY
jgi:hypothetical protein